MILLTAAEDITAVANALVKLAPYGAAVLNVVAGLFHPQTQAQLLTHLALLQAETAKNAGLPPPTGGT